MVTNKTGHRLPSGVGFRRAFLEFRVSATAAALPGAIRLHQLSWCVSEWRRTAVCCRTETPETRVENRRRSGAGGPVLFVTITSATSFAVANGRWRKCYIGSRTLRLFYKSVDGGGQIVEA